MTVTEIEAKAKKCCVDTGQVCRASGCMGWRWVASGPSAVVTTLFGDTAAAEQPDPADRMGFCGRAGAPGVWHVTSAPDCPVCG